MNGTLPIPLPVLGVMVLIFMGVCFAALQWVETQDKMRARLARVMNPEMGGYAGGNLGKSDSAQALDYVAKLGAALAKSGILSDETRRELENTIMQAGMRGSRVFGIFIGSKVLLMLGLPLFVYLVVSPSSVSPSTYYLSLGGSFAVGMLAPDFFIKQVRAKHLTQVAKGLPDALDMLVICAQAGLGLENAIDRVAQEFVFANQAVATELAICASEMRIGSDRRMALQAMGDRTGLDVVKRLTGTLIQTMQFGTPLSHALRVLAAEMRTDNLTAFEERAARLPVLLTLPMILFVLPCVFIVVGGPAFLQIAKMFSH
jgi:tight adherence protein C